MPLFDPAPAAALDRARVRRQTPARTWARLSLRAALLPLLVLGCASWSFPMYALGYLLTGRRPPVVTRAASFATLARRLVRPAPAPGVALVDRVAIAISAAIRACLQPVLGLAWWLDELLYGRALAAVEVRAPLFELSAARSGSTQLARYLEDDPALCAPSAAQSLLPLLWLWRLYDRALHHFLPPERLQALYVEGVPREYLARHEGDIRRTDSMDPLFYAFHLVDLLQALGPDTTAHAEPFALTEQNRSFWEQDFVDYVDRLLRKTLLHAGAGRPFVKGHFLPAADALHRRYPDATFLTVLRDPEKRIQSVLNFHREQPGEPLALLPWTWILARDLEGELRYDEVEQAWYERADGPRRVVIPFDAYVRDLPGTLQRVYAECFGAQSPSELPQRHVHRARTYAVDRSLAELGVDMHAFRARSAPFVAWMNASATPSGDARASSATAR